MKKLFFVFSVLGMQHAQLFAADTSPTLPGNLIVNQGLQVILALAVTLATIWGLSRLALRKNLHRTTNQKRIRLLDSIALGTRERIILLEVEDQRILVASTPGNLHSLHAFGRKAGTDFSETLTAQEASLIGNSGADLNEGHRAEPLSQ